MHYALLESFDSIEGIHITAATIYSKIRFQPKCSSKVQAKYKIRYLSSFSLSRAV